MQDATHVLAHHLDATVVAGKAYLLVSDLNWSSDMVGAMAPWPCVRDVFCNAELTWEQAGPVEVALPPFHAAPHRLIPCGRAVEA